MDESIIFPSPNWFQATGLVVSSDNWVIYSGPSKSLCVLESLPEGSEGDHPGNHRYYEAHVQLRAHPEKILCLDISPDWPKKREVLAGSADGSVKQWRLERVHQSLTFKSTHSHEIHYRENEEVVGVAYCNNGYAVTVGCYGHIAKWDLTSNVAKDYKHILKSFKPVCLACSPHLNMNVAIGTKQGIVLVLDITGTPRVVYKIRTHDEEVTKVSWCPQYEVKIRKSLVENEKRSAATQRMEKIRKEPVKPEVSRELDERVKQSASVAHFMTGQRKSDQSDASIPEVSTDVSSEKTDESIKSEEALGIIDKVESEEVEKRKEGVLNKSGTGKTLPEDSFDESIVPEDDMFDIYKDHESDEFGHKKYQGEDIVVKIAEENKDSDYLADCEKLKEEILKRKNKPETSIETLVEAMDKTHVGGLKMETVSYQDDDVVIIENETGEYSTHIHRHLLATIGKHGSVQVWSKTGKQVSFCSTPGGTKKQGTQRAVPNWPMLLWCTPDVLLIGDGKTQLLKCNPLKMDCKHKLEYRVLHKHHKRGLFVIATNAPRVQSPDKLPALSPDQWVAWTAAQDRYLVQYSLNSDKLLSMHNTCGGFLYNIVACPYDATRLAISVGDGAIRVWQTDTLDDDDSKLSRGQVTTYWQNVQGKVLTVAWHPTRENWLAFGTAESRVGIIDTGGKNEKPAVVLQPSHSGGVYSLCWGEGNDLYACGGGEAVIYNTDKIEEAPTPLHVELEGLKWELSALSWYPHGAACGSNAGAVAVLTPQRPHVVVAATFVFSKMIHTIDWHPQETSNSSEPSPYRNLIAVCSLDKASNVVVLEFGDNEAGTKQLSIWKTLSGHKNPVSQVMWNPHVDELLLSTSQDSTVRIWNVTSGVCTAMYCGHPQSALGAAWSPFPQFASRVLSGGADCCLRYWHIDTHTLDNDNQSQYQLKNDNNRRRGKKDKRVKKNNRAAKKTDDESSDVQEDVVATLADTKYRPTSKRYLYPMIYRQLLSGQMNGLRKLVRKQLERFGDGRQDAIADDTDEYDTDYIKIFGNINEVNEVLDIEMERHEDTGHTESWMVLNLLRGRVDAVLQHASQRDLLDPFLVSVAPCVSLKYWKDATLMYMAQIDRLEAKRETSKLYAMREYGGAVFRKTVAQLSVHDVRGAVKTLVDSRQYMDAYVLCRTRYIDSIAEETLRQWATHCDSIGLHKVGAVCYTILGDLTQAATVLGRSNDQEYLSLAAEIAKVVGQNTFADHMEKKKELIKTDKIETPKEDELEPLPSRVEVFISGDKRDKETRDTEKMMEELPKKMELLMKDVHDTIQQEGKVQQKVYETKENGQQKNVDAEVDGEQKTDEVKVNGGQKTDEVEVNGGQKTDDAEAN